MDEKPKKKNKPVSDFDALHSIAVATGAGFTLLSSIGVGVWLGLKCDEYFGTKPFRLIVLSIVGAASGLWSVVKQMLGK
ncbi:MAG TPA: AtpZ/AtpI family protein [Veillonellaceae bacterium]|nr:AtpZ/AtpI family protein [Veillonellaceae bacterium]